MEINWAQLLDQVQDLRGALETWGVTYQVLVGLGFAAFALFLISLREIVVWYLRISQLQAQMLQMSRQLNQIQNTVNQVQVQTSPEARNPVFQETQEETKPESEEEQPAAVAGRKKFNLDH